MEEKIKKQYTKYTYPRYQENMDKYAPIPQQYSDNLFLEQINHYIYSGKKTDFNNYKVLVAGVGIGSDIISMGFLLKKYKNIKLLGIDVSPTVVDICNKRVQKYELNDIEIIEMSLLDLEPNIHGKFDLIICIGVLHHLIAKTSEGLNRLKNVLEDDGGMAIMVYGKYGRTGVYQMQDLLKKMNYNINEYDYVSQLNNFKNVYNQLPNNNWFKLGEHLINDHNISDEGIMDELLHCQDRAYSISELYEWVKNCDLNIVDFAPDSRYKYKYNINNFIYPNNIIEKYAINELFFGDIIKHSFYISKNINTKAKIDNLDNILIFCLIKKNKIMDILSKYKSTVNSLKSKKCSIYVNTTLTYKLNDEYTWYFTNENCIYFEIEMNEIIYTILNNIDNKKTLKEIFNTVRSELNIDMSNLELLDIFKPIYEKFELYDMILLKTK
jgi:SAM-dependent methyltransferase